MGSMTTQMLVNGSMKNVEHEVLIEHDIWQQFIHVRLQTRLLLTCELQLDAVTEAFQQLRKKVRSNLEYKQCF